MNNLTTLSTHPCNHCHARPCPKSGPRTCTLLTPRSSSGPGSNDGLNSLNMTKTCPLRLNRTNLPLCRLPPSYCPRPYVNICRGLRRPKSNATPQDSCLLIYRPPWMNSSHCSVCPLPRPPKPLSLHRHDLNSILSTKSLQLHKPQRSRNFLRQIPHTSSHANPRSSVPRGTPSPLRLHA